MSFCKHASLSKLKNINQPIVILVNRDYSNWNFVKTAINDKRSDNSQSKKRANHWKDFIDNIVKLKFIDSSEVSPSISNVSPGVKPIVNDSGTATDPQSLIESDKLKYTENRISAEKYGSNMVTAPVGACVGSDNNFTSTGNDFKGLMDDNSYKKANTLPQIATANLAFSISSFFDKKFQVKTNSVSIYPKKCPCQRCQTLRKINRLRRNHE